MKSDDSKASAQARRLCADIHPDDGPQRPRRKESHSDSSINRKTLQLCSQVQRALYGVIPAPAGMLEGLSVEAVEPDPDASRLRVVVGVPPAYGRSPAALERWLIDSAGYIRSQVAPHIHRKRVPLLTFELLPKEVEA